MFSIIQDPCDSNITIYRDDDTGFYNITKALAQYKTHSNLKTRSTKSNDWMRQASTKTLIESIQKDHGITEISFIINDGKHAHWGTYVHPILYTQFMCWVNTNYHSKSLYRLYELNHAQGDIVIERIGKHEVLLCKLCQFADADKDCDGLCNGCFDHSFPTKSKFKSKEHSFMLPLQELYPEIVHNRKVSDGCSVRRPDGFLDLLTHVIIIEIDEHQHRKYNVECENRRTCEISQDIAHRNCIFIRLNPDSYKLEGKHIEGAFHRTKEGIIIKRIVEFDIRFQTLLNVLQECINDIPDKMITIKKLYFDGYTG